MIYIDECSTNLIEHTVIETLVWIHPSDTTQFTRSPESMFLIVWVQKRPAGAWSRIRFEALTAARVPQMAQRQGLSLRKVTECVHKSEREREKSDNTFIESLVDSGVN